MKPDVEFRTRVIMLVFLLQLGIEFDIGHTSKKEVLPAEHITSV